MSRIDKQELSRRERQIMDVIYRLGRAGALDVQCEMKDPPSYSAVRAFLRILEEKGFLRHEEEARRYVYAPTQPRGKAARGALKRLVRTFFEGSVEKAVAALLSDADANLTPEQLDELAHLIERSRSTGRQAPETQFTKGKKES